MHTTPPVSQRPKRKFVYTVVFSALAKMFALFTSLSTCVVGCTVWRGPDSRKAGIQLFRIPACPRKRAAWIRAISRKQWEPKNWGRVCGRQFVSGELPEDSDEVDYRPTLFMKGQEGQCLHLPPTLREEWATKRLRDCHMRELSDVIYVNAIKQTLNLFTAIHWIYPALQVNCSRHMPKTSGSTPVASIDTWC